MELLRRASVNILREFVKYAPIVVQFIIIFNILDEWIIGTSFTNYLYPIIGHSVLYDVILLILSRLFKFCLWHRILIYNMILNIVLEWFYVNIPSLQEHNFILVASVLSTGISCIISILLKCLNRNYYD